MRFWGIPDARKGMNAEEGQKKYICRSLLILRTATNLHYFRYLRLWVWLCPGGIVIQVQHSCLTNLAT